MEIGTGPVEQADDGSVDVPHLVSASRAKPYLGFRRMHTEPGAAPAVLPYEAVPSGGRGPDRAEPLGEHGERAGRNVPVCGRGDHVLNRLDLGRRQSIRCCAGTAGPIVKRTRVLSPAPGMEPAWRHTQEAQDSLQREVLAGPIHGAQDPRLGASVPQTLSSEAKPGGS